MKNIQYLKTVIIFQLLNFTVDGLAQEGYCCQRNIIFPPFNMPEGQESDYSGEISSAWLSNMHELGKLSDCPL